MSDGPTIDQRAMIADLVGLTGADPVLTESHNWAGYTHRALYEGVHANNDPGAVTQAAAEWADTSNGMLDSSLSMIDVVKGSEDSWEGEAADATRKALGTLAEWGANTAAISLRVSRQLDEQAEIMAEAKAAMPEPVDFDVATEVARVNSQPTMAGFVQSLTDFHVGYARMNQARDEAVAVMSRMEERSRSVDQAMPVFAAPPDPISRTRSRLLARRLEPEQALTRNAAETPSVPGEPLSRTLQQQGTAPSGFEPLAASAPAGTLPGGPGGLPGGVPGGVPGGSVPAGTVPSGMVPPPGSVDPNSFRAPGSVPLASVPSSTPTLPPNVSLPLSSDPPTVRMPAPGSTSPANYGPTIPTGRGPGGLDLPRPQNPGIRLPESTVPPAMPFGPNNPGGRPNPNGPTPPRPMNGPNVVPFKGSAPNLPGGGPGGGPGGVPGGPPASGTAGAPRALPGAGAAAGAVPSATRLPGELPPGARYGAPGGQAGQSGMSPGMGGMGGGRGQGAEDKERNTAYRIDDDLFEVPGTDLPPSVIGGKKPRPREDS